MTPKKQTPNFEAAMQELETIVLALEKGDLSLDDALKHFEQGISLIRTNQKKLEEAQQKVQILMQGSHEMTSYDSGEE